MLKCPRCGAQNNSDSSLCVKCNQKLKVEKKVSDDDIEFERLLKIQFEKSKHKKK